ncbi:hypothetical protein [Idiomarina abyssalis]|uniref:hypothetical protein n=1 Tax=Idiomarina abyssalis TaxID=86102 RepID=UPI003A957151
MESKGMRMIEQAKQAVTSTTSIAPGVTGGAVFGATIVFPEWINHLLQAILLISSILWIWYQIYARRKEVKKMDKENSC